MREQLTDDAEPMVLQVKPAVSPDDLIDLIGEFGREVYYLLDDCETSGPDGEEIHTITEDGLRKVSAILDRIEALPFEEPGVMLGTGAMLQAAIMQTFAHPPQPAGRAMPVGCGLPCGYDCNGACFDPPQPIETVEKAQKANTERDEARAQVAAAYGSAADALQNVAENWDCGHNESRLCDCARDAEQWSFAADEVRSMTPDDAKAALEAYGREKMREGVQRAASLVSHSAYGTAYWAILAEMDAEG